MTQPKKLIPLILERVRDELEAEWVPTGSPYTVRASEAGDCPRYLQYRMMGKKREKIHPELALLFRDGHLHHEAIRGLLRRTHILTNDEQGTAKTYPNGITVTATTDGIIDGEFVIDIKGINFFSFKYLDEKYLKTKYPHYVIQVEMYLDVYGLDWGVLLFKCKMTSALKEFWIPRNPERVASLVDRFKVLADLAVQRKLVKRPYTKSSKECKGCGMRIHCWKVPMQKRGWK